MSGYTVSVWLDVSVWLQVATGDRCECLATGLDGCECLATGLKDVSVWLQV